MNNRPLFTVATITYNSSKWVREAIESVLSASFQDFEYIIADDCSTDETWNIVQSYNDSRIRSWRNERNLGEYPNRNKVLEAAKGKYIYYIDGDDILYKNTLKELAEYLKSFPQADAIWGVYSSEFDFVVFPYLFDAHQLTALHFLSTYPIAIVGFAESLFGVDQLKQIGGFDTRFATGDTYIKKKFSTHFNALLIPAGKSFWRISENQASKRVKQNYRQLIENFNIDKEILYSNNLPLNHSELISAIENFQIRTIKLIVKHTIFKCKFFDFIRLMKLLGIPWKNLIFLFQQNNYHYKVGATSENPIKNEFNFTSI